MTMRRRNTNFDGCGKLIATTFLVWAAIALLVYSCMAYATMQVYLEGEDDLGNGYKLCRYSEGITITVASHKLCPLSINVPN
jgi:hypothetical protein